MKKVFTIFHLLNILINYPIFKANAASLLIHVVGIFHILCELDRISFGINDLLALLIYLIFSHFDIIWNLQKLQSRSVIEVTSENKYIHVLHLLWCLALFESISIMNSVLEIIKIYLNAFKSHRCVSMVHYHPLYWRLWIASFLLL